MDSLGVLFFIGVLVVIGVRGRNVIRGLGDEGLYWVLFEDGGGGGGGVLLGG